MKKLFIAIVSSALFFTVQAQVSFGPKAGVNNSLVSFSNGNFKSDPLSPAFNAGGFLGFKFAKHFAAQAEVFYSGEGSKYKQKGYATVYTDKFGYLDVPVLFKYVSHGGFYLATGPQVGFLLSATQSANGTSESIKSNVNSNKFSWCFGLGLPVVKNVGIDLRYALGLTNINKGSSGSIKASVISIDLFYAIHAKTKSK